MERPPVEKLEHLTVNSNHNLQPVFEYVRYLEKELTAALVEIEKSHAALESIEADKSD